MQEHYTDYEFSERMALSDDCIQEVSRATVLAMQAQLGQAFVLHVTRLTDISTDVNVSTIAV